MGDYRKLIGAIVGGVGLWGTAVVNSTPADITSSEWMQLAGVAIAAFLVWLLPNTPGASA